MRLQFLKPKPKPSVEGTRSRVFRRSQEIYTASRDKGMFYVPKSASAELKVYLQMQYQLAAHVEAVIEELERIRGEKK